MTDEDLNTIESQLGIALPAEYRQFALNPSCSPGERYPVRWFFNDARRVITATLRPMEDAGYDRQGWQDSYLVIGEGASGDLLVLDTSSPDFPVHCLSHETHAIEPEWPTLHDFVTDWQTSNAGPDSEFVAAVDAERRRLQLVFMILGISIGVPLVWVMVMWLLT